MNQRSKNEGSTDYSSSRPTSHEQKAKIKESTITKITQSSTPTAYEPEVQN